MIGKRIIFSFTYHGDKVEALVLDKVLLPKEYTFKFLGLSFKYYVPCTYWIVQVMKTSNLIRIPADPQEKTIEYHAS